MLLIGIDLLSFWDFLEIVNYEPAHLQERYIFIFFYIQF